MSIPYSGRCCFQEEKFPLTGQHHRALESYGYFSAIVKHYLLHEEH
ncbi:MAG: hypothetical protein MJB14_06500 [Spirochaetes bacterium]|nr:hypothetical protein [Spirochaetota bacterium]